MTTETTARLIFTVGITSTLFLIGMGVGAIAGGLATWIEKRRATAKARKVIASLAGIAEDSVIEQAKKVKADKESSKDAKELARMVLATKKAVDYSKK